MKIQWLDRIVNIAAGGALIVSTTLIILNVINRYLIQGGLLALADMDIFPSLYDFLDYHLYEISVMADEVPGLLLAWIAFLGAYLAMREGGHIAFDMLTEKLSIKLQSYFDRFSDFVIAIFLLLLFFQSLRMIQVDGATEIETAEIAQGWFMAILVVFPALTLIAIFAKHISNSRSK